MGLYTRESKDRVRDAVDFLELVSARTELRRAGPSRYEGLCPFHEERTPSFGIDPHQKLYHCFGCQASGDVFTFVQETEGLDFKGALELLAERCGVELEREQEDPRDASRRKGRERLLELLGRATSYYERYLWESNEAGRAREYLEGRGLGEEVLREFRVGYAPSAWDRMLRASRSAGFSEQDLYATGLAQRSRQTGQPYDRFRSRIMFPLADIRRQVRGFGARAMRDGQRPKYLNTADNEVYHKGLHLYGAQLARAHATRAGQVILCEGYTDTIALHQAGLRNSVGLMGTALTGEQVAELGRMASTLLLALDADSSGQEAVRRAYALATRKKLKVRVVELPPGTDPAELIRQQGAAAMEALVESSVAFERFSVERVLAGGDHANPEGRDQMLEELRPVFAPLRPSAMRMELTRLVSERLNLPESLAERALRSDSQERSRAALAAAAKRHAGAPAGAGQDQPASADRKRPAGGGEAAPLAARGESTERTFLALCIASPSAGAQALAELDPREHFTGDTVRRAAEHLRVHLANPGEGLPDDDPQLAALIAELDVEAGRESARPELLEVQRLQLELARVDRHIQRARGQERGAVRELALRRAEVKREFDRAYGQVLEEAH
jgi:DNA primase